MLLYSVEQGFPTYDRDPQVDWPLYHPCKWIAFLSYSKIIIIFPRSDATM
jgi:hypothetical protein